MFQMCKSFQINEETLVLVFSPRFIHFPMTLHWRRLGLRDLVGRLWHHFFRESTLPPHQVEGPATSPSQPEIESYIMTNPVDSAPASSASAPTPAPSQATTPSQTLPIRDSKSATDPAQQDKKTKGKPAAPAAASGDAAAAGGEKALTPAELKKKAKEEKAARRAKEKLERESGAGAAGSAAPGGAQGRPPATPKKDAAGGASQKGQKAPPPRRGSGPGTAIHTPAVEQKKKKDDKKVAVFGHLYGQQRRTTVAGAAKEVHPAVLALGLQLRDYVVCGSSARCVATLLAFKRVSFGLPLPLACQRMLTETLLRSLSPTILPQTTLWRAT